MRHRTKLTLAAATPAALLIALAGTTAFSVQGIPHGSVKAVTGGAHTGNGWCTAVDPKPLTGNVTEGLEWLVGHQHPNGGWGQGDEAAGMTGGAALAGKPNVADTCVAAQALLRSGSTPAKGPYAAAIANAIGFICSEIEASDADSLSITSVSGTRVQSKIGPYIDTFLTSVLLPEVKGTMPDEAGEQRVVAALEKVLHKIEVNQRDDGTWGGGGWAPVLSQSMATKGLNRAGQAGMAVDTEVLGKSEEQARNEVESGGGADAGFTSDGSAGVALYAGASNLGSLQDSVNTNRQRADELREIADNGDSAKDRDAATRELERFAKAEAACSAMQQSVIARLDDDRFIAGFGSNGGEEFLSYMNIGESLVVAGGEAWAKWDASMTSNLNRIQNADGSWTGHHCITGRTFCTATALLVLMADRTPVPVEAMADAR